MPLTKVSSKYQIVIPKKIRQRAHIKEGQSLNVYALDEGILLTPEKKWPDNYIGTQKDVWKDINIAKYLKKERNSWQ